MRRLWNMTAAVALAGLPVAAAAMQTDPGLVLRAVRFYRADQDLTRVKGIVQIPFRWSGETAAGNAYTVSVRVADSSGLTLYQQSWQTKVSAGRAPEDAYAVEIVDFTVAPGTYRLEVAVGDSASGRPGHANGERAGAEQDGEGIRPAASPGHPAGGRQRHRPEAR